LINSCNRNLHCLNQTFGRVCSPTRRTRSSQWGTGRGRTEGRPRSRGCIPSCTCPRRFPAPLPRTTAGRPPTPFRNLVQKCWGKILVLRLFPEMLAYLLHYRKVHPFWNQKLIFRFKDKLVIEGSFFYFNKIFIATEDLVTICNEWNTVL